MFLMAINHDVKFVLKIIYLKFHKPIKAYLEEERRRGINILFIAHLQM